MNIAINTLSIIPGKVGGTEISWLLFNKILFFLPCMRHIVVIEK